MYSIYVTACFIKAQQTQYTLYVTAVGHAHKKEKCTVFYVIADAQQQMYGFHVTACCIDEECLCHSLSDTTGLRHRLAFTLQLVATRPATRACLSAAVVLVVEVRGGRFI